MALGPHERVGKHGVLVAGRVLHETDAGPDCFFSCSLSLPAVIGDSIRYICGAMEANARVGGDAPRQAGPIYFIVGHYNWQTGLVQNTSSLIRITVQSHHRAS